MPTRFEQLPSAGQLNESARVRAMDAELERASRESGPFAGVGAGGAAPAACASSAGGVQGLRR
eukprot:CAMPEP_0202095974 /NCGR_PEP_ID=MMETSP0965-20130614/347_1 /ASSEMBLY_ACC=CAM_ASM_000507 /TAXON_ID=4773 /ORGANISM="Schizochytrium aggregatum, Strain ATCC28209" /LENGTH=62 /DNA_ID=CAMNT_0048664279 /DNA_START=133 /DNA_END=318 /DNA_ORIENTATION=+